LANTFQGAVSYTLPKSPAPGVVIQVLDNTGGASTNNITISPPSGATINGSTTNQTIAVNFGGVTFTSKGNGVYLMSDVLSAGSLTRFSSSSATVESETYSAIYTNLYTSNMYVTNLYIGTNQSFAYNFNTNQFVTNTSYQVSIKNGALVTNLNSYGSLVSMNRFTPAADSWPVSATLASQAIESDSYSWISVDSDSAVAGARVITLIAGQDNGQILIIKNADTDTFRLEDGSVVAGGGTVRLNGVDWDAAPYEAMLLVYDSLEGNWSEVGRFGSGTTAGFVANLTPTYVPYANATNTLADSPILRVSTTNVYVPTITFGSDSAYFNPSFGLPSIGGRLNLANTANGNVAVNLDVYAPTNISAPTAVEIVLVQDGSGNRDISYGGYFENDLNSAGTSFAGDPIVGNIGFWADSNPPSTTSVNSVGLVANSRGDATNNIGLIARVRRQDSSTTTNIAVLAEMERPGAYTPTQVGIYVTPSAAATTNLNPVSSMLLLDSLDTGYPAIISRASGAVNHYVAASSGYAGGGTKYLSDDGTYKSVGGTTINPTDNRIPYRSSSTTFGDSAFQRLSDTNSIGFNSSDSFIRWIGNSVAVGRRSLTTFTTAGGGDGGNVAIGDDALPSLTDGYDDNTAVGGGSGLFLTVGSGNTLVGSEAATLGGVTNLSKVVAIGFKAGRVNNITNAVAIGDSVPFRGNNTAQIGTNGVEVLYLNGTVGWYRGSGSPEGAVTATVGSFYSREDGGAGTSFYVKESGTGDTGWVGK